MLSMSRLLGLYRPGPRGQWISSIIACLCAMSMGFPKAWSSAALPIIRSGQLDFTLDTDQQAAVVAVLYVACIITPFFVGPIMTAVGKRATIFWAVWLQVVSWIMLAVWGGFWVLLVARFLAGIWTGICYTCITVYVGEVMEPGKRASATALSPLLLSVGAFLQTLFPEFLSYREMSWVCLVINVCIAVALCFIPETPYYYLERDEHAAAEASLIWLRGRADPQVLSSMEKYVRETRENPSSYVDLFRNPASFRALLIVGTLSTVQRLGGMTVLVSYASVTLPPSWFSPETSAVVLNATWIITSVISVPLMDLLGRRVYMAISCAGSAITMLATAVWFYLFDKTTLNLTDSTYLPLVLLIIQGVFFCFGLLGLPGTLQSELFPTEIKNKASSLTACILGVSSVIATYIYLPIQDSVGPYLNFIICALANLVGLIVAIFFMIESKGKSLEDIQYILSRKDTYNANGK